MKPASPHILVVRAHRGLNPHIRLGEFSDAIRQIKKHRLELSPQCFLFDSLDAVNLAVSAVGKHMIESDEFLIFPVSECYGALSSESRDVCTSLQMSAVHVPLIQSDIDEKGPPAPSRRRQ